MLRNLLTLLGPEKIEEGFSRGQSGDLGLRQVFGRQVIGQMLYAAKETVPEERLMHPFHSYLLCPGDSQKPIIYNAEVLRSGDSLSAYCVTAIQNGKPIFYMTAFSQTPEDGSEYWKTMPDAPGPDKLKSETEIARSVAHLLSPLLKEKLIGDCPLEVCPVEFHNPLKGHVAPPTRQVWIRADGELQGDLRIYQYLLGYTSDPNFLPAALQPYGIGFLEKGIQIATIDHSVWFRCPFNIDEWLSYNVESISASGARGFVYGKLYTQDGVSVAFTIREEVMRNRN